MALYQVLSCDHERAFIPYGILEWKQYTLVYVAAVLS